MSNWHLAAARLCACADPDAGWLASKRRLMAGLSELGNLFGEAAAVEEEAEIEEVVRRKRQKNRAGCANEVGLRFYDTVPVKKWDGRLPPLDARDLEG